MQKKYRYRDLKQGDAYYAAWRGRWVEFSRIVLIGCVVIVLALLGMDSIYELARINQSGRAGSLEEVDAQIAVAYSAIAALGLGWVLSEVLRAFVWKCPRCGLPYRHSSRRAVILSGLLGGVLYPLSLVAWMLVSFGDIRHPSEFFDIFGWVMVAMLVPRISTGLVFGAIAGEIAGNWRGAETDPSLGWLRSRLRLGGSVCANCHLPKYAPHDPEGATP